MAYNIIKYCGITHYDKILDFGCAKGFIVKAFRLLGFNTYGTDISEYVLEYADPEIKPYIGKERINEPDWVIAKDIFEHLDEEEIKKFLKEYRDAKNMFLVIPLGDGEKFVVPEYEKDVTHVTKQTKEWWEERFKEAGWEIESFNYLVPGVKDNWSHYKEGNGFWILQ